MSLLPLVRGRFKKKKRINLKLRHDSNAEEVIVPSAVEKKEENDMKVDLRSAVVSCIDSPPRLK